MDPISLIKLPFALIFLVFKKLYVWIEEALLLDIFRASHFYHRRKYSRRNDWHQLCEGLEYHIYHVDHFNRGLYPNSQLAIRCSKDFKFRFATIVVEAKNYTEIYQDSFHAINLEEGTYIFNFQNIPDIEPIPTQSGLRFSVNSCGIIFFEAERSSGEKKSRSMEVTGILTHTNYLNGSYIQRWGTFWNLDLYNSYLIETILDSLYKYILGIDNGFYWSLQKKHPPSFLLREKIASWVIHQYKTIRTLMWLFLILRLLKFSPSGIGICKYPYKLFDFSWKYRTKRRRPFL